jgi:hypothetical protein
MTKLLTKEQAQKLHDIGVVNINDGFTLPNLAYLHGKDVQLMTNMGGDLYFSNYWYGPKEDALKLGEMLAEYFKQEYEKLKPFDEGDYDFWGMVMFWENGANAMVGNINLDHRVAFWDYDEDKPAHLFVPDTMKQIMFDANDNSPYMVETHKLSKEEQQELLNIILKDYHSEYLEGINQ